MGKCQVKLKNDWNYVDVAKFLAYSTSVKLAVDSSFLWKDLPICRIWVYVEWCYFQMENMPFYSKYWFFKAFSQVFTVTIRYITCAESRNGCAEFRIKFCIEWYYFQGLLSDKKKSVWYGYEVISDSWS